MTITRRTSPAADRDAGRRFLEVHHVARRLSVSYEYVRRLLRRGELAGLQMGNRWRIDPVDLEAFIEKARRPVRETFIEKARRP